MPALFRATNIFIEYQDLLCDTDTMVCDTIYRIFHDMNNNIFEGFDIVMDNMKTLKYVTSVKRQLNPLIEYCSVDGYTKQQIEELCESYYDGILYTDRESELVANIKFTSLAKSILPLVKDDGLENIYIYVKKITPSIHTMIYKYFYNSNKVHIVSGNKEDFLKKFDCECYCMRSVDEIKVLLKERRVEPIEILVPEYQFNMKENSDHVVKSEIPIKVLIEKYKIELNTIKLPL